MAQHLNRELIIIFLDDCMLLVWRSWRAGQSSRSRPTTKAVAWRLRAVDGNNTNMPPPPQSPMPPSASQKNTNITTRSGSTNASVGAINDVDHEEACGTLSSMQEAFLHRFESLLVMHFHKPRNPSSKVGDAHDGGAAPSLESIAKLVGSTATWASLIQRCSSTGSVASSFPEPEASVVIPTSPEFIVNPLAHYPGVPSVLSRLSSNMRLFGPGTLLRDLVLLPKELHQEFFELLTSAAVRHRNGILDGDKTGESSDNVSEKNSSDSDGESSLALSLPSELSVEPSDTRVHGLTRTTSPEVDSLTLELDDGDAYEGAPLVTNDLLAIPLESSLMTSDDGVVPTPPSTTRKRSRSNENITNSLDRKSRGAAAQARATARTGTRAAPAADTHVPPEVFLDVVKAWLQSSPSPHVATLHQRIQSKAHCDNTSSGDASPPLATTASATVESIAFEAYCSLMLFASLESQRLVDYTARFRNQQQAARGGGRRRARLGAAHLNELVIRNANQFNEAARLVTVALIEKCLHTGTRCCSARVLLPLPLSSSCARGIVIEGGALPNVLVGVLAAVLDSTTQGGAGGGKLGGATERSRTSTSLPAAPPPQPRHSARHARKSRKQERMTKRRKRARRNEEILVASSEDDDSNGDDVGDGDPDYDDSSDYSSEEDSATDATKAYHRGKRSSQFPTLRTHCFHLLNPVLTLFKADAVDGDNCDHSVFLHERLVAHDGADHIAGVGHISCHLTGSAARL